MFCALAWGRATTHTDRTKRVDRPDPDRTNETYFAYVIVRSRERANLRSITFPRNRSQTHDSIESSRPIKVAQLPGPKSFNMRAMQATSSRLSPNQQTHHFEKISRRPVRRVGVCRNSIDEEIHPIPKGELPKDLNELTQILL